MKLFVPLLPLRPSQKMLMVGSTWMATALLVTNVQAQLDLSSHKPRNLPNPNGYDLYIQAERAIIPAKPPIDPSYDTDMLADPKQRAERYSLARREAWLKANAAGFALFDQAQKLPGHWQLF